MPDELMKKPIQEQLKYIQWRTKIFDNYRAIREDMFQKLMGNISDTITVTFNSINILTAKVTELSTRVDSLTATLETTKTSLHAAVETKNSINIFGNEVNKLTYNTIMWLIVASLTVILVFGFLSYKRSIQVTHQTEKELKELKDEFQVYRKTTREAREKMSMDHFNELKKLKGG
jgi:cell division protein FtsB